MLLCRLSRRCWPQPRIYLISRSFTTLPRLLEKALPARRKIDENEFTESFLRGTGPGGQKINKTSSAVQLRHLPSGIVVKCQETRSREQNRKLARQMLSEKLDEIEKGSESRTAIKAERARVKKASANKKSRRKYRKLAEEKGSGSGEEGSQGGATDVRTASESSDSVNGSTSPAVRP